ncbi:MAG TPA: response regulator [Chitinophagaceae bacterium]|jgi:CheY-like chemotaxis protein
MKKLKVVLVDNDEDELLFMKDGFESTGLFTVIAASNSEELFEFLSNTKEALPDLIISDLNMPRKNGINIAKAIHSNPFFSGIPVIILTISASKLFIQQAMDAGAYAYFTKPQKFNDYIPFARMIYNKVVSKLV